MDQDLFNILSHSNKDIDNQKLMDYLSGHLSSADQHQIERELNENGFLDEAMEGLREIQDKAKLKDYVEKINGDLSRKLALVKSKHRKNQGMNFQWVLVAVVLILMVGILGYWLVKLLLG